MSVKGSFFCNLKNKMSFCNSDLHKPEVFGGLFVYIFSLFPPIFLS